MYFVWNYISELLERSIRESGNFLSAFDIHRYTPALVKFVSDSVHGNSIGQVLKCPVSIERMEALVDDSTGQAGTGGVCIHVGSA